MNVKVKAVVEYGGHNISANGAVNFVVKAGYDQLTNIIQLFQMLNNDVCIKVKIPEQKPFSLGMFRIKNIATAGDGSSKIKFNGLTDYVELDKLNELPMQDADNPQFIAVFEAEIEDEE